MPRTCYNCQSRADQSDIVKLPICDHAFHAKCLEEYTTMTDTPLDLLRCPNCRSDIGEAAMTHLLQAHEDSVVEEVELAADNQSQDQDERADDVTSVQFPSRAFDTFFR